MESKPQHGHRPVHCADLSDTISDRLTLDTAFLANITRNISLSLPPSHPLPLSLSLSPSPFPLPPSPLTVIN
ncbi:hypothetical protein J6590_092646 [Homalodisca vitripennis]|nr:hypothetical protein J6590_092646 [Homalodisca vitripennis]